MIFVVPQIGLMQKTYRVIAKLLFQSFFRISVETTRPVSFLQMFSPLKTPESVEIHHLKGQSER